VLYLPADLYCPGDGVDGADVARCLPSFGRGRAVARRASRKTRTGSGGQRRGTAHPNGEPKAEASEDRTLEVVLARR